MIVQGLALSERGSVIVAKRVFVRNASEEIGVHAALLLLLCVRVHGPGGLCVATAALQIAAFLVGVQALLREWCPQHSMGRCC